MKNQILNNLSNTYLSDISNNKSLAISKIGKLRFDQAEGLFQIPKRLGNKLVKIPLIEYSSLPDRDCTELKKQISIFLGVETNNISIFPGSDEIIELIPRLYLNPKDISLCVVPTFSRMVSAPKKVGAKSVLFKLYPEANFKIEGGVLTNFIKINKPKMVWICTPNNPTGVVTPLNFISKLILSFPKIIFVINEVYQEWYSLDPKMSAVSLVAKNKNLIVLRSFSKAFGLAGLRVGYAVGHSLRISELDMFRTMYNTSVFGQKLTTEALKNTKYISDTTILVQKEKERLFKVISNLKNIDYIPESKTNLIFLRHKAGNTFEKLYKKGYLTSNWNNVSGIEKLGYVRISIGQKIYNNRIITALKEIN